MDDAPLVHGKARPGRDAGATEAGDDMPGPIRSGGGGGDTATGREREKVGIFFGSTSYGTADAARLILAAFGRDAADLYDVARASAADVERYRRLVFGTSTWGDGGLQHDWDTFIHELDRADLEGKVAAVFALGDQVVWSKSFVDSMRTVHDKLKERGAHLVGSWPSEGYTFDASRALDGDHFVGLALDKMNQRDLTASRVEEWVSRLRREFGME
jgi:flavodoxin I